MDCRLTYSTRALADLDEVVEYIAVDDEAAARRFGSSLLDHVDLLRYFPKLGAKVSGSVLRLLTHSPVLVYYRVQEDVDVVEIVHIRHGSREPLTSGLGEWP